MKWREETEKNNKLEVMAEVKDFEDRQQHIWRAAQISESVMIRVGL